MTQANHINDPMQQMALGLQLRDGATFDNFYVGENEVAIASLKQVCQQQEKFVFLVGGAGSGRTHLLQACCHETTKHGLLSTYIPVREHALLTPALFENLEQMHLVCLDDVDAIVGLRHWEEAVFHLYNRILQSDCCLLVSANAAAPNLQLGLPDLRSRLAAGITFQLRAVEHEQKVDILVWRAKQRGMFLSEDVANFLLTRCSRDMTTLLDVLDQLDRASLAEQRRLTIPFIKSVLGL